PGSRARLAVLATDQRTGDPVALGRVLEGPAALVAVPLLVDLGLVTGQPPGHLAATPVGAHGAAGRAVLADARRRDQVEGPGPEPVGRTGQRTDGVELDGGAGGRGGERGRSV